MVGIERKFAIGSDGPLVREAAREPRLIARHHPDEAEGGFTNGPGSGNGELCEDVIGRGAGFKHGEHGARSFMRQGRLAHEDGHDGNPHDNDTEEQADGEAVAGPAHGSGRGEFGRAHFPDRKMHDCRKQPEGNAHPPDGIIGAELVIEPAAEPDAEEGTDLVAEENEAIECCHVAGAEHDGDEAHGERHG